MTSRSLLLVTAVAIVMTLATATTDERASSNIISLSQQQQQQQQRQQRRHRLGQRHEIHTRQLQPPSDTICTCSPRQYTLRFNFAQDCTTDTIENNLGVHGTLCMMGGASLPPGMELPSMPPPAPTNPPVTIDAPPSDGGDPFLPPPPSPSDGGDDTGTGTGGGGSMPTWWPTFSPTTFEWANMGGMPTANNNNNNGGEPNGGGTYEPTVPWPTYAPTSEGDDSNRESEVTPDEGVRDIDINLPIVDDIGIGIDIDTSSGLTKQQLKKIKTQIRESDGSVHDMNEIREGSRQDMLQQAGFYNDELSKQDRKDVKKQVRTMDMNGGRGEDLTQHDFLSNIQYNHDIDTNAQRPHTIGVPTYQPTYSYNENETPYPTDDGTYAPTPSDMTAHPTWGYDSYQPTSYAPTTAGHVRNLELHSSRPGGGRKLLRDNEEFGIWKSVPINDEFFMKFPVLKSHQEEIYKVRTQSPLSSLQTRSHHPYEAKDEANNSNIRQLQDKVHQQQRQEQQLIPNQLLSAQFLEMDTSQDMNIINQNDVYLNNITFPPNSPSSPITEYTLTYTSISSTLDPNMQLGSQMNKVPGGVILILLGVTAEGEVVRNRLMWTYTNSCGEDDVTILDGDGFGWTMFERLEPALEEYCPASAGLTPQPTPSPIMVDVPTTPPPTDGGVTPGMPTPSPISFVTIPPIYGPPSPYPPTKRPTSPSGDGGSKPSVDIDYGSEPSYPSYDSVDESNIGPGAKASKPHKPSSVDYMSMPGGTGLIMHHFNLSSSRSGKRRKQRHQRQLKVRKDMKQMMKQQEQQKQQQHKKKQQREAEDEKEIFGRRISKHREAATEADGTRRRRKDILFASEDHKIVNKKENRLRRNV